VTWDVDLPTVTLERIQRSRERLFDGISESKIPCRWFVEHHDMIDHINSVNSEHIINLDFHSDLTGDGPGHLTEGNVFDNVYEKQNKTFTWIYPYAILGRRDSAGRCDNAGGDAFSRKNWLYKEQHKTCAFPPLTLLNRIKSVGICFSPDWISPETMTFISSKSGNLFRDRRSKMIYESVKNIMRTRN